MGIPVSITPKPEDAGDFVADRRTVLDFSRQLIESQTDEAIIEKP